MGNILNKPRGNTYKIEYPKVVPVSRANDVWSLVEDLPEDMIIEVQVAALFSQVKDTFRTGDPEKVLDKLLRIFPNYELEDVYSKSHGVKVVHVKQIPIINLIHRLYNALNNKGQGYYRKSLGNEIKRRVFEKCVEEFTWLEKVPSHVQKDNASTLRRLESSVKGLKGNLRLVAENSFEIYDSNPTELFGIKCIGNVYITIDYECEIGRDKVENPKELKVWISYLQKMSGDPIQELKKDIESWNWRLTQHIDEDYRVQQPDATRERKEAWVKTSLQFLEEIAGKAEVETMKAEHNVNRKNFKFSIDPPEDFLKLFTRGSFFDVQDPIRIPNKRQKTEPFKFTYIELKPVVIEGKADIVPRIINVPDVESFPFLEQHVDHLQYVELQKKLKMVESISEKKEKENIQNDIKDLMERVLEKENKRRKRILQSNLAELKNLLFEQLFFKEVENERKNTITTLWQELHALQIDQIQKECEKSKAPGEITKLDVILKKIIHQIPTLEEELSSFKERLSCYRMIDLDEKGLQLYLGTRGGSIMKRLLRKYSQLMKKGRRTK